MSDRVNLHQELEAVLLARGAAVRDLGDILRDLLSETGFIASFHCSWMSRCGMNP